MPGVSVGTRDSSWDFVRRESSLRSAFSAVRSWWASSAASSVECH